MAYNCLLLDADDTLVSFKDCEKQALTKVLEKYKIPVTEENITEYHNINEGLWQDLEKGKIKKHLIGKIRFQKFCEFVKADAFGEAISEKIFRTGICLPSDVKNTDEDMERIISIIKEASNCV